MDEVSKKIFDPFGTDELAPIGFQFLSAANAGLKSPKQLRQISKFYSNSDLIFQKSNEDYNSPAYKSIPLSEEPIEFDDSLTSALFKRRSIRTFSGRSCSFESLSFLLKVSAGFKFTELERRYESQRFFPSGGALYTTRVYVDVRNVIGVDSGIYRFNPFSNTLDLVSNRISADDRVRLHSGLQTPDTVNSSCFEILVTTRPFASLFKYGEHGWKVILMEAGHLLQNIWLTGVGCGFSMYPSTSIDFAESEKFLRTFIKGEVPLASMVTGLADDETDLS